MDQFERVISESGIPTTDAAMKAVWKDTVIESGSSINNDSRYSPFWRLVSALITKPTQWLMHDLLIKRLMPDFYLKTATGDRLDQWGDGYGLTRKLGTKTQGYLSFERADAAEELTLPAGTAIKTLPLNGIVYSLLLVDDLVFPVGTHNKNALVEAEQNGAAYNLEAGYYSQIDQSGLYVSHGTGWITRPGVDDESEHHFRQRIRNQFNSLSFYHTDGVYRRLISEFAGIPVDNVWFEHDAPRGPGTANAYVLFELAAPEESVLQTINRKIMTEGNHGHGDDVQVFLMPEQPCDITATVYIKRDIIEFERNRVMFEVEQMIRAAFRQNAAYPVTLVQPKSRFSFARLTGELVRQFPELNSVEFEQKEILSDLSVPTVGSLTLTLGAY